MSKNRADFINKIVTDFVSELVKALSSEIVSVCLIGSTAEGQTKIVQDVDLLIIVEGGTSYLDLVKVGDVAEQIASKYSSPGVQVLWTARDTVWEIQPQAKLTIGLHLDVLTLPRYYQRLVHQTNLGLSQLMNCKIIFGPDPLRLVTPPRLSVQQLLVNITGIAWLHAFLMTAFTVMDMSNSLVSMLAILDHCMRMAVRSHAIYLSTRDKVIEEPLCLSSEHYPDDEARILLGQLSRARTNISSLSAEDVEEMVGRVNSFFERLIVQLPES